MAKDASTQETPVERKLTVVLMKCCDEEKNCNSDDEGKKRKGGENRRHLTKAGPVCLCLCVCVGLCVWYSKGWVGD